MSELPEGVEPPPRGHRAMALVRWVLVLGMAVVAFLSVGYALDLRHAHEDHAAAAEVWYCPMHPAVVADHAGDCPICGMALVKREGAAAPVSHVGHRHRPEDPFVCPMHPEETGTSAADRCPVCKMHLEPRSKVDAGPETAGVPGLAAIDLTLDRVQLVGMKTAKVTEESLTSEVRTVGVVAAPEGGLAKVTTRYAGFVESVVVAETGKKVKRGQLLAAVYSPQIYLAEQEYLTSKKLSVEGLDLGAEAKKRLDLLGVPPGEIAAVDKNGKPSKVLGVFAPIDGFVVQKSAVVGLSFQAGTELYTLADLSKVWVLADLYEAELARVQVGQTAKVAFASLPNRTFEAAIKLIYPSVDPVTRTTKARLELDNAAQELAPGMYATVTVALPPAKGLVVPREALVDTGELQYVFVDKGAGRFEPRRIAVGVRAGEKVEVRSGLVAGETVVTTGNFLLDSESRLRAALEGK